MRRKILLLVVPLAAALTLQAAAAAEHHHTRTRAHADVVPKFDIARECQFEIGSKVELNRCVTDETQAREKLQTEWKQFTPSEKDICNREVGGDGGNGVSSYLELQACLGQFVTYMAAPIASGWSGCRVGLAPTGKRRLCTAHTNPNHDRSGVRTHHRAVGMSYAPTNRGWINYYGRYGGGYGGGPNNRGGLVGGDDSGT